MRFSLRKVVKYATFLLLIALLNIWITYSVTIWTSSGLSGQSKVLKSLKLRGKPNLHSYGHGGDNGHDHSEWVGNENDAAHQKLFSTSSPLNNRRSAKAVFSDNEIGLDIISNSPNHENNVQRRSVQQVGDINFVDAKNQHVPMRIHNRSTKTWKRSSLNASHITDAEDIHVSVKTTLKYHKSRVKLILKTWYRLASEETFFFTDGDDRELTESLGNHVVNTNCSTDHSRRALSCKMAVEFDFYLASRKRWFCHVDDDVYVNIPQLVNLLQKYNHKEDWYLGKPSLKHPLEVADRENPGMKLAFWFATGGAGFCISRSLALKMAPYAGGGRFMTTAERIRLPDDCTLGYIIEYLLRKKLTVIEEFHSHLEALGLLKLHALRDQITFSFSEYSNKKNVINVPGFDIKDDPTRFKTLHCFLFPTFRECRGLNAFQADRP